MIQVQKGLVFHRRCSFFWCFPNDMLPTDATKMVFGGKFFCCHAFVRWILGIAFLVFLFVCLVRRHEMKKYGAAYQSPQPTLLLLKKPFPFGLTHFCHLWFIFAASKFCWTKNCFLFDYGEQLHAYPFVSWGFYRTTSPMMFSQGTFTNPNVLGCPLRAQWLEKRGFRRFMGGKDGCGWDIQTMEDFSCRWFRFTPPRIRLPQTHSNNNTFNSHWFMWN